MKTWEKGLIELEMWTRMIFVKSRCINDSVILTMLKLRFVVFKKWEKDSVDNRETKCPNDRAPLVQNICDLCVETNKQWTFREISQIDSKIDESWKHWTFHEVVILLRMRSCPRTIIVLLLPWLAGGHWENVVFYENVYCFIKCCF